MARTSSQIFFKKMIKTNADRHREFRERKKTMEGSNYLAKDRKRQKLYTRKPRNFLRKNIEGTKRSSENESTKTSLIPKTNF